MDEEKTILKDSTLTVYSEKEKQEMRWTTFSWTVQNYSKLKEGVLYYRKPGMFSENIKLSKNKKYLFLTLHADDAELFVNFTILRKDGEALNEGVASEFVGSQYVADFDRDLLTEKNGYIVNNQLTIQCKYIKKPIHGTIVQAYPLRYLQEKLEMLNTVIGLRSIFFTEICSDFKICVPPIQFRVHKVILAVRSNLFRLLFDDESLGVNFTNTEIQVNADPSTFYRMLLYIYTAEFHETSVDDMLDLIELALCFDVKGLISDCSEFLCKNMTSDNVGGIFLMASMYNYSELQQLRSVAFDFISSECPELLKNDEIERYLKPMKITETCENLRQLLLQFGVLKYIGKKDV